MNQVNVSDLPILYSFRRCPYAMRARLALFASDTRCRLREVVLRDKPAALLQASPKGTVPVLVLPEGKVLEESLDIMLWALHQQDPQNWLAPQEGNLQAMLELIQECDERFKRSLDRYKYPGRFTAELLQARQEGAAHSACKVVGSVSDASVSHVAVTVDKPDRHVAEDSLVGSSDETAGEDIDNAALSVWAVEHRDAGAAWLATLEARLQNNPWLFGRRPALADMAIAPFVRQYAHVDKEWFDAQPWPGLQAWLRNWMESDLFEGVMAKYRPWTPDSAGELFA